jgi:molybdate transport system substrate-binding protein
MPSPSLHGGAAATPIGRFPPCSHPPIVYPVAVTRRSTDPRAAMGLASLRPPRAMAIFASFGHRAPD